MTAKKPKLDKVTAGIAERLMKLPPKHHEDMKVGRSAPKKKRSPTGRASSSKPHSA
jgi:hypothetical protein